MRGPWARCPTPDCSRPQCGGKSPVGELVFAPPQRRPRPVLTMVGEVELAEYEAGEHHKNGVREAAEGDERGGRVTTMLPDREDIVTRRTKL